MYPPPPLNLGATGQYLCVFSGGVLLEEAG